MAHRAAYTAVMSHRSGETASHSRLGEARLALKFTGVSMLGFAADALLLQVGVSIGVAPAWARLFSLAVAMQLTFVLNARLVFLGHDGGQWRRQWVGYMLANGVGNIVNYWIFVALISTRWPLASNRLVALAVGAAAAWAINFACSRFLVFRRRRLVGT
jgi:putative flippase GtrA